MSLVVNNLKDVVRDARDRVAEPYLAMAGLVALTTLVNHYFQEVDALKRCITCALKVDITHSTIHHETVVGLEMSLRDVVCL